MPASNDTRVRVDGFWKMSATMRPASASRGARRRLQLGARGRAARAARRRVSSAPVRKWRGKAGRIRQRCCVLTWNLFHGRRCPTRRARCSPSSPRGSPAGSGTSRCCRRCRRGGRPSSAARAGASARTALTSRNWLLPPAPLGRASAAPTSIKSGGGGAQRDPRARARRSREHRVRTLRVVARAARGARRAPGARLVGRATCTPRRTPRRARRPTSTLRRATATAWAARRAGRARRRPQHARIRARPGFAHVGRPQRRPRPRARLRAGRRRGVRSTAARSPTTRRSLAHVARKDRREEAS